MSLPVRDDTGGGGPSGLNYTVLSQQSDLLVLGASRVVNAMTILAEEMRHGVVFGFTIPRSEWLGTGTSAAAGLRAGWVSAMADHDHVIGLSYSQDVNASGDLYDAMEITVGDANGANETTFSWPLATLNTPAAFQAVDDAYNQLQAVAAGQA